MGVLPESRISQVQFFESRNPIWVAGAAGIGLSVSQAGELTSLTIGARSSYDNMILTRNAAKAATAQFYADSDAMKFFGADLIKIIRAFANSTNDPTVFTAAQIPPPGSPTPLPAPAIPTDLQSGLLNSGFVELSWRGSVSPGGTFTIWRSFASSAFEQIGLTGAKTFVDDTMPAGTPAATYFVKAHRGVLSSDDSEPIFVRFGNENITAPLALAA